MNRVDSRGRKRRIFLLLSAILIPTAVLVFLVVRVARQDAELTQRRTDEERRAAHDQLRRLLSARLQAVKLEEVNRIIAEPGSRLPPDSPIVFVAAFEQDRIILPWEKNAPATLPSTEYSNFKSAGEAAEFRDGDSRLAVSAYAHAFQNARLPAERCEVRLASGRAASKAGLPGDADRIFRGMIEECDAVRDSDGISYALYAAERLMAANRDDAQAQTYAARLAGIRQWRPPNEAYLLRSLLEMSKKPGPELSAEIHDIEQIVALSQNIDDHLGKLQRAFRSAPGDLSWMGFGDEPWLVTVVSPVSFAAPVMMAVSSRKVVPAGITLRTRASANATSLGEGFIDLYAELPQGNTISGTPTALYVLSLALVVGATLLAAYLLMRDVNREVQTAEMRAHFVASVSHELKTPLTAIRAFAETLMLGRAGGAQATNEYLRTILSESERLSRLVDNVPDFSRIEQGRKIYRMKETNLEDVVRSAARSMEYPLSQLGFALTISNLCESGGNLTLHADADAIEQVLLNLIGNAMKYSGDSRRIEIQMGRRGNEAFVAVTDHGIGIARDDQAKIFEKFHRIHSDKTDGIAGTGLGLALALHAVEAHHGTIDVTSEAGRGSTFSIRIPLEGQA